MAQTVKHLPTMRETWVQSLGWEDLLEKEMATHSSTLTWRIPWRILVSYSPWGHKQLDMTERLQSLKETKDLYAENYKTLMKDIKNKQMERYNMFLGWKKQYCENDYTAQSTQHIQCNPYQFTNGVFHRIRTKNLTICVESQKTLNSQSNLSERKTDWRNQPSWLQSIPQSYGHQGNMVLAQKQKYRQMEQYI